MHIRESPPPDMPGSNKADIQRCHEIQGLKNQQQERSFAIEKLETQMAGGNAGFSFVLFRTSVLVSSGNMVFAAPGEKTAGEKIKSTKEEKGDERGEQITAETLTIEQGETFEIEKDFTGLSLKKGEKAALKDVVSEDGQGFFADRPGTYLSTYLITPEKGDSYEAMSFR